MTLEELAKEFVELFDDAGLDGIADEMTISQIDTGNKHWDTYVACQKLLGTEGF